MRYAALVVCAALLLAGCVQSFLPRSVTSTSSPVDALPAIGSHDLAMAELTIHGDRCLLVNLVLPGNASRMAARLPNGTHLVGVQDGRASLVLTLARCRVLEAGGDRYTSVTWGDLSIPHRDARGEQIRHRTLEMVTGHPRLAEQLTDAGLPAEHVPVLSLVYRASYHADHRVTAKAPYGPFPVELSVTPLTAGRELPDTPAPLVGWERAVPIDDGPRRLVTGFEVEEATMVTGDITVLREDRLTQLLVPDATSVWGYELRTDLRVGVLPGGAG